MSPDFAGGKRVIGARELRVEPFWEVVSSILYVVLGKLDEETRLLYKLCGLDSTYVRV